jgi:predicted transcriptional regulator
MMQDDDTQNTQLTAEIVAAYVAHNKVAQSDLAALISRVSGALAAPNKPETPEPAQQQPAVSVRSSVKPDSITCLECGKKFRSLRRHLRTEHGLEADAYREKWGLRPDYPMAAPSYAETRSNLAKGIGFGRRGSGQSSASEPMEDSDPAEADDPAQQEAAEPPLHDEPQS